MKTKKSVVVLISGSGSNLQAIIDRSLNNDSAYDVVSVISNRPDAYGLTRASNSNIPQQTLDHTHYANREDFDLALIHAIDTYQPDLVVLAGFMRILTTEFVQHYAGRLLNIHPSLLPKYQGLHTHQRALDAGDKQHGVSVHFVTEELDGGPIVMQSVIDIEASDTADSLQSKIHKREHKLYPHCINWYAEEKIYLHEDKVFIDGQPLDKPLIYERIHNNKSACNAQTSTA